MADETRAQQRRAVARELAKLVGFGEACIHCAAAIESALLAAEIDPLPARPACLGRPHVVANQITSEAVPGDTFVSCQMCDARLSSVKTGGDEELQDYAPGMLVGIDCPGHPKEPAHHYAPKRSKAAPKAKGKKGAKK